MNLIFKYYGPAIVWAFFILVICNIPMGKVASSPMFFEGFDKLVHMGLFAVLSILYCSGSLRKWRTRNLRIQIAVKNTIVLISYGALIEVLQQYIFTWRSADGNDLFADAVGACLGIFSVMVTTNSNRYEKS
jgi:VanZ family protein